MCSTVMVTARWGWARHSWRSTDSLPHWACLRGGLSCTEDISINLSHTLFCLCVAYISSDLSVWYFRYLGRGFAPKSCSVFFSVWEGSCDVLRKLWLECCSGCLALSITVTRQGRSFIRRSISFIGPYNNRIWSLIPSSQFYGSWGKLVFLSSVITCTLYIIKKGFYFNFSTQWSVLKLQLWCFMDSAKFNDFLSWIGAEFSLRLSKQRICGKSGVLCNFLHTSSGFLFKR